MSETVEPDQIRQSVSAVDGLATVLLGADVFVAAAGFEDRAFRLLDEASFSPTAIFLLLRFVNDIVGNRAYFEKFSERAKDRFAEVVVVTVPHGEHEKFLDDLNIALQHLPREARSFAIDISGMPNYVVCSVLKSVREHRSREPTSVYYTSAVEYSPSYDDYQEIVRRGTDEVELLPRSMAQEMAENITFEAFVGYRSKSSRSCLAVFAGHEAHRTTGVVDAINPALLLLMYGRPGDASLEWRLDLSRRLHRKFERSRRVATAVVSTLDVRESLETLETFYDALIDEYDLVIAPIGSKMQSVAAYLFWERYGEVQLTFPLPVGYDLNYRPIGASTSYRLVLAAKRTLFRDVPQRFD